MRRAAGPRIYEDFQPSSGWVEEDASDTLVVSLSGFSEENIWIQFYDSGNLKISGECPLGNNKWRRFSKEFAVPSNCYVNDIQANFHDGNLYIILPKIIIYPQDEGKPTPENPTIQEPASEPKSHAGKDHTPHQKATSTTSHEEQTNEKTSKSTKVEGTSEQKERSATNGKSTESIETMNFAEKTPEKEKQKRDESADVSKIIAKERRKLHEKVENYMDAIDGTVVELNKPIQLAVNVIVASLMVVVLAVYVTYKFGSS